MSPQVRLQQARARYDRAMRWGRGVEDALAEVEEAEAMIQTMQNDQALQAVDMADPLTPAAQDKFLALRPATQVFRVRRGQVERAR